MLSESRRATDETSNQALIRACQTGPEDDGLRALELGADPNAVGGSDSQMEPALSLAANSGMARLIRGLLARGARLDERSNLTRDTALGTAACRGHPGCVLALVEAGADIEARGFGGFTPLMSAANGDKPECLRILIDAGANLDARCDAGDTALLRCMASYRSECANLLLDRGADPWIADKDGLDALHWVKVHARQLETAARLKALALDREEKSQLNAAVAAPAARGSKRGL